MSYEQRSSSQWTEVRNRNIRKARQTSFENPPTKMNKKDEVNLIDLSTSSIKGPRESTPIDMSNNKSIADSESNENDNVSNDGNSKIRNLEADNSMTKRISELESLVSALQSLLKSKDGVIKLKQIDNDSLTSKVTNLEKKQ